MAGELGFIYTYLISLMTRCSDVLPPSVILQIAYLLRIKSLSMYNGCAHSQVEAMVSYKQVLWHCYKR